MFLVTIAEWVLASLALAWVWFALIYWVKPKRDDIKKEKPWLYYTLYGLASIGWLYDIAMNVTVFTFLFMDPPSELTVTNRIMRYLNDRMWKDTWRYKLARVFKVVVFDPIDPEHLD